MMNQSCVTSPPESKTSLFIDVPADTNTDGDSANASGKENTFREKSHIYSNIKI